MVDATVAQVEQHVHGLEGTLSQGQGIELEAPTISARCMRDPAGAMGSGGASNILVGVQPWWWQKEEDKAIRYRVIAGVTLG